MLALLYPLEGGYVTSAFSRTRRNPVTEKVEPHLGADVGNGKGYGVPVIAPVSGVVVKTVTGRQHLQSSATGDVLAPGRSGNGVLVGAVGGGVCMVQHVTPMVREGDWVTVGQQVGVTDRSGIQTAAHVHTEWWPTGKPASAADPAPFLVRTVPVSEGAATSPAAATPQTPAPSTPALAGTGDDPMIFMLDTSGRVFLVRPGRTTHLTPAQWARWQRLGYALAPGCPYLAGEITATAEELRV